MDPPAKSSKHSVRRFAIPINLNAVEHVTQAAEEHLGDIMITNASFKRMSPSYYRSVDGIDTVCRVQSSKT